MKKYYLPLALWLVAGVGFAQTPTSDNFLDQSPLQVFFEDELNYVTHHYLLEKKQAVSPDAYHNSPVGQSKLNFQGLALDSTQKSVQYFRSKERDVRFVFGSALGADPALMFYKNQLCKLSFKVGAENGVEKKDLLHNMTVKFGKPEAIRHALPEGIVREYRWSGYKVTISLFAYDGKGSREQLIVIQDKMLIQLAEAEIQNRKFVKEPLLYSDVASLFR